MMILYLLLFPFIVVWRLLEFLLKLIGRLILVLIGLISMCAGLVLCFTIIGLALGIPLIIIGFILILRAII
jgi:hypothetical protein